MHTSGAKWHVNTILVLRKKLDTHSQINALYCFIYWNNTHHYNNTLQIISAGVFHTRSTKSARPIEGVFQIPCHIKVLDEIWYRKIQTTAVRQYFSIWVF